MYKILIESTCSHYRLTIDKSKNKSSFKNLLIASIYIYCTHITMKTTKSFSICLPPIENCFYFKLSKSCSILMSLLMHKLANFFIFELIILFADLTPNKLPTTSHKWIVYNHSPAISHFLCSIIVHKVKHGW